MSDTPPDRLCNNPKSPFFNEELLERGIGIRFNGVERNNVEEYCVSEGLGARRRRQVRRSPW